MTPELYRGAPMGRPNVLPATVARPFSLRRVRLDRGGYSPDGAYWGLGAWLYHAMSDDAEIHVRAADREHAKEIVSRYYPGAEFWR